MQESENPVSHERDEYQQTPEVSSDKERKAERDERLKSVLHETPLAELTPETVRAIENAIERNIDILQLPPELAILGGVRVDDVGIIGMQNEHSVSAAIHTGQDLETALKDGVEDTEKLVDRVGRWSSNNGTITYIDHLGRAFAAPISTPLVRALNTAGYEGEGGRGYVYCSNADWPADSDRIKDFAVAHTVADRMKVLEDLERLGVDKTDEISDIVDQAYHDFDGSNKDENEFFRIGKHWQKKLAELRKPAPTEPTPPSINFDSDLPGAA